MKVIKEIQERLALRKSVLLSGNGVNDFTDYKCLVSEIRTLELVLEDFEKVSKQEMYND